MFSVSNILNFVFKFCHLIQRILHILLRRRLNTQNCLVCFFICMLYVLNRNNIIFLETFCQEIIHDSFSVWKFNNVIIFVPLRDNIKLSSHFQSGKIHIGSSEQTNNLLTSNSMFNFVEPSNSKGSRGFANKPKGVQFDNSLS